MGLVMLTKHPEARIIVRNAGLSVKPRPPITLGVAGTQTQYATLKQDGLPLKARATYESWSQQRGPAYILQQDAALHATPFITWQPVDPAHPQGHTFSIAAIDSGSLDWYIRPWAQQIKAYHKTVYIRFAHEMNGYWYPWSAAGPTLYKAAWRRVWRIFHEEHTTNVRWVWAPDGIQGQPALKWETHVQQWWPGAQYVDYVGMTTVEFATVIGYGLPYVFSRIDFLHRYAKPFVLPEVKVAQGGQYAWLRQLPAELASRPWIKMLIWSETPSSAQAQPINGGLLGNMNWLLESDPTARLLLARAVGEKPVAGPSPTPYR